MLTTDKLSALLVGYNKNLLENPEFNVAAKTEMLDEIELSG